MKTYLNVTTGLLTLTASAVQGIKKLDVFDDNFVLQVVPDATITGAAGILAAKVTDIYSGNPVVLDAAWEVISHTVSIPPVAPATEPTEETVFDFFQFVLDMTSEEFLALFSGEKPSVTLMAQVTFTIEGNVRRTQVFQLVCARPVYRAGEVIPHPTETMPSFRLSSPDGSQWTISITNDGQITRSKL